MKTFNVKIRAKGSHGKYGKEVFREMTVSAETKKEATELVKQEMLRTTYYDFYPAFKMYDEHNIDWYGYSITYVFPMKNAEKYITYGKEEMHAMVNTLMTAESIDKIEIFVK